MKSRIRIAFSAMATYVLIVSVATAEVTELQRVATVAPVLHLNDHTFPPDLQSRPTTLPFSSSSAVADRYGLHQPGWHLTVDMLHFTPRIRGLDYAALDYGNSLALGTGSIQRLEYADEVGIRAGCKHITKTGWGVGVEITTIDFSGFDSVERPPDSGQLFATRVHPDSNQEADTATAKGGLDFRYLDLMGSRSIYSNAFSNVEIFGGVRWAQTQQSLVFDYDGRDFLEGRVTQQQTMHAFGLRMGAASNWRLANGFGILGRFAGGLMHGRFDTHARETNVTGVQLMSEMSDDFSDLVSTLELSLALSWQWRWLTATAGYELNGWFNANNRALFVDDQHEGVFAPFSNDILLEGYFVRLAADI